MWRMGLISLLVHLLLLGMWGWRFNFSNPPQFTPLVVEFKNIQDVTKAPRLGKVVDESTLKDSTVAATSEPAPLADIEQNIPKEEIKPEEPIEETKPEPKPQPKEEKKESKEKTPPKKIEKPLPEKKKPPKPKEKPKPEKKKDKKTKPDKAVAQLKKGSKNGEKKAPKNKHDNAKTAKDALDDLLSDASDSGADNVGELSASHIDALRSAIKQCWAVPAGLLDARNIAVEVHIELNSDGTVMHASIVDQARLAKDPNFKIAADAAYRAVVDPACQPFPLPKDKYSVWKEIDITFDAHSMFN